MVTLVVLAKACLPGRVKTRLHPPLTLDEAARVAAASLDDTLAALASLDVAERILCFDGDAQFVPDAARDYRVVPQVDGDLDERIGAIFDAVDGAVLLVGMDTPQLDAATLAPITREWPTGVEAWFGAANDGGFWMLALADLPSAGDLVRGVPMSLETTGEMQLRRLHEAGIGVAHVPSLTDIDDVDALFQVAATIPGSRTASVVAQLGVTAGASHE